MPSISAYLLNTLPTVRQWHLTSIASQYSYFSQEGIKLNVLDDKHHLVRRLINLPINPLLRKLIRIYDFLDSGDDYGLFMDLDTLIINNKRHKNNIRDWCSGGRSYIDHYARFGLRMQNVLEDDSLVVGSYITEYNIATLKSHPKWEDLPRHLTDRIFFQHAMSKYLNVRFNRDNIFNTGFALLTREFCEFLVNRLEEFDLSLNKKQGLDNLIKIDEIGYRHLRRKVPTLHDEHLMELVMNTTDNDFQKKLMHSSRICCHGYRLRVDSTCQLDFSKILEDPTDSNAIFLHLISCRDDDAMDSIFRLVGA